MHGELTTWPGTEVASARDVRPGSLRPGRGNVGSRGKDDTSERGGTRWLGTIRVNAVSEDGEALFVGIAPEAEVDAFLADVAHEEFHGLGGPGTAVSGNTEGGRPDGVDI